MNLYEINKEFSEILNELYDDDGNVNQEMLIKLDQTRAETELAIQNKFIAIAAYIQNLDAERNAIDMAKKSMLEREKRFKKKIDELQGYLLTNMETKGIKHISCPYFDIRLKRCPPSVEIIDESVLPDEYRRFKTESFPDKIKIKEEMLMGVLVPGAQIKSNLRLEIK